MADRFISPLRILNLFIQYSDRSLSERFIRGNTGLNQQKVRDLCHELVEKKILQEEGKKRNRSYRLQPPEDPEEFTKLISLLSILEEEWHEEFLDDWEPRTGGMDLAVDVSAGSISRFLDHMVFLEEIASIILTSREFKDVFRETFRRLIAAVDFDIGFAVTVESDLKVYMIHKMELSEGVKEKALKSTRELLNLVVALPFIPSEYMIADEITEMVEAPKGDIRHRIGVSFERDRMTPGLLALFRLEDHPFLADEKQVLDVLGSQMSLACRNINALDKIGQLAREDDLTGINNKRTFRTLYKSEYDRAKEYSIPLKICMMDMDHFKAVNDRWGHQIGDVVLSEVAAVILRNIRSTDILARYGGEEFVLLLPHTEKKLALSIAEKIRAAVESFEFPGETTPIHCTISIGVATLKETTATADDLVSEADTYLYKAKAMGRNLVFGE